MMKTLAMIGALALVAARAVLPAIAAETHTSYPLWCKGGGAMKAQFSGHKAGDTVASVTFQWMKTAATAQTPPHAGECSWLDRAASSGEPAKFVYNAKGIYMIVSSNGGQRPTVTFTGGLINPPIWTIWNGVDQKADFKLMVYNSGAELTVTAKAP